MKDVTSSQETTMNVQNTSKYRATLVAAALSGALSLMYGATSSAADSEVVRQVVVRYDDLNLTSPRGASTLYRRISAAAREVCDASDLLSRELGTRAAVDACVQKAISGAVTDVGRSELFAIYNAKNPRPLGLPVASAEKR
jgi:UrcA family protein